MTDAALASADAGSADAAKGAGDQGSNAGAADPLAGLDTGSREWVEKNGVKSLADAVKTAREAQSLIGRSVQIPADDAKPEDVDKFLSKATEKYRPKDAAGYEFKLPDGVPEGMPYDAEFAGEFKQWAHDNGLTASQAQKLHDNWVGKAVTAFTKSNEDLATKVSTATADMEKEWGASDSEGFKANAAWAVRAGEGLGLMDALKEVGLLGPDNLVLNSKIAVALAKVGQAMFKEDSLEGGGGGAVADNPFKEGPGKGNLTEQMQLIRTDRPRAIRLIRAAGHEPKGFGLTE